MIAGSASSFRDQMPNGMPTNTNGVTNGIHASIAAVRAIAYDSRNPILAAPIAITICVLNRADAMSSIIDSILDGPPPINQKTPQTRTIAGYTDCIDAITIRAVAGRARRFLADSTTSKVEASLVVGDAYGLGSFSGWYS
jgi:hypothetical protein